MRKGTLSFVTGSLLIGGTSLLADECQLIYNGLADSDSSIFAYTNCTLTNTENVEKVPVVAIVSNSSSSSGYNVSSYGFNTDSSDLPTLIPEGDKVNKGSMRYGYTYQGSCDTVTSTSETDQTFVANTTYCMQLKYYGKLIMSFEFTTASTALESVSNFKVITNKAPTATNLFLTNTPTSALKGDTLTLNYTYNDEENSADSSVDVEDGTTFKWYKADDASGTNKSAINGATSNSYTTTTNEEGKYIGFSVTPVNDNGTGTETFLSDFIYVTDTTSPTITSTTPTNGASEVAVTANIQLMFHEVAEFGSGKIKIVDITDGNASVEIDVQNHNNQLTIMDVPLSNSTGSALTISPIIDLSANKTYRVEIEEGALVDKETTPNPIDSNSSVITFKTPDTIAPKLASSIPADDSTTFDPIDRITLTFDENISKVENGGSITIYDIEDNSSKNYSGSDIEINGTMAYIKQDFLKYNRDYYITIDGNSSTTAVFQDLVDNNFTGISDATTLSFKTKLPTVDLSSLVVADRWNMITVPDGMELDVSSIPNSPTILFYNNKIDNWEIPTTLKAWRGYWLKTNSISGYDSISTREVDKIPAGGYLLEILDIEDTNTNEFYMFGNSNRENYNFSKFFQNIHLAISSNHWTCYNSIFYYDANSNSWRVSGTIPALGAVWAISSDCYQDVN